MIKCNYFILFTFISLISVHYAWLNRHHHYHSCVSKNSHRNAHVLTSSSISKVPPSYRLQRSQQSVNDDNNESSEKTSSTTTTSTGMVLHLSISLQLLVLFMTMFIECINLYLFIKCMLYILIINASRFSLYDLIPVLFTIISYITSFNIFIVVIFSLSSSSSSF